ncbi:MAG TPA: cation diffusion facilitator family transporter [Anaerolineales bacterium]|nr:cation diffusion facilitator family transporter [Anaerolineales bacterium]
MTHERSSPVGERDRKSLWAINLGLGVNILLSLAKTTFGILTHSPALLAEGINSTSDVAYYVVASIFMRLANKPADNEHPYGHRQLESIASLVVGAFVVATAIAVFWDAADKMWDLMDGELTTLGSHSLALWVALATVAIKIVLFFYVRRLGKETRNPIVDALAYDHRNDIFSASAASVGIFLGQNGLPWGDPLAGALVALLILRTGVYILRESSVDLMDAVPSKELAQQISTLIKNVRGVQQLEELQAHRFGPHLVVNLTIGINGSLTVRQGDRIATKVESLIYESIPNIRHIHVHYHPAEDERRNMSIDDILAETRKHVSAHEMYSEEERLNVSRR